MLIGSQTWEFRSKPAIIGAATVVGPEEGEGPLSSTFDFVYDNLEIDEKTWEKAERKLLEHASALALVHAGIDREDLSFFIGGDLMNQIITATFAARTIAAPYLGVFGACSTSMESLALAAFLADAGGARYVMAGTASHNCTVEKQFRYPTEYGSQNRRRPNIRLPERAARSYRRKVPVLASPMPRSDESRILASRIRLTWERRWPRPRRTRWSPTSAIRAAGPRTTI
ncbi:hypothetical protein HMSSN139_54960 [Paenibacillus sp. HMSSN-139]|nr:hypothetical protein HMSSN139_54960 [Paenibacillus sp. HMSSN-139]